MCGEREAGFVFKADRATFEMCRRERKRIDFASRPPPATVVEQIADLLLFRIDGVAPRTLEAGGLTRFEAAVGGQAELVARLVDFEDAPAR